jgi:hypothetical protein
LAHQLRRPSALLDVALQPPLETQGIGRIHIHAQVIEGQQFFVVESKEPFDDEERAGSDSLAATPDARVGAEVVDGAINVFSARQRRDVPGKQGNLDQRRVVEVLFHALGQG